MNAINTDQTQLLELSLLRELCTTLEKRTESQLETILRLETRAAGYGALAVERDSWQRRAIEAESCLNEMRERNREAARLICEMGCADDPLGATEEDPLTDLERMVLECVKDIARRKPNVPISAEQVYQETGIEHAQAIFASLVSLGFVSIADVAHGPIKVTPF